jgi:glucose/arabinose dehydrogenase
MARIAPFNMRIVFIFSWLFIFSGCSTAQSPDLKLIDLPAGFHISVFADQVKGARSMSATEDGKIVFVGTRSPGKVYAVVDQNLDGNADQTHTLATGLNYPNGVAYKNGSLYVAEINRILRFDLIKEQLQKTKAPVVVYDRYPTERHHGWKYIKFGPDGLLYVPVGAPCNICLSENTIYASITRLNTETGKMEIFAQGVRNTVGFDWHPNTGELWFTDNGRDMMGDNLPPDELNCAPKSGLHFGYPYCHAGNILDPEFGALKPCDGFAGCFPLRPHSASLGMTFYTGNMFPAEYQNAIFFCEHGSWNRSKPIGYRVSVIKLSGRTVKEYTGFAEGFLTRDEDILGRPVDVLQMPDGALLVSDDHSGKIYRITYTQPK